MRGGELFHFHDDMYFSDSRYSIGVQLADLCAYFIARHLNGDSETEGFYKMIQPHIVFSKSYPEEPSRQEEKPAVHELDKGKAITDGQ